MQELFSVEERLDPSTGVKKQHLICRQGFSLYSPAKVNIRLRILDKRPDSFHNLWMDMIPVGLWDRIDFFPAEQPNWKTEPPPRPEEGLLLKALRLVEEVTGCCFCCSLRIQKRIPFGAGLGGSSGNAGTLLRFLKALAWVEPVDWYKLALELGSDVPFFLRAEASIVEGRGETLSRQNFPSRLPVVLYKPDFPIFTGQAFAEVSGRPNFQDQPPDFVDRLYSADFPLLSELFHLPPEANYFWQSALPFFSALRALRQEFLQAPEVQNVLLSGSGSSLVLYFADQTAADFFFERHQDTNKRHAGRFFRADLFGSLPLRWEKHS